MFLKNSSRTISSITPLNLEPRPIRLAFGNSTLTCATAFPDFHAKIHWQLADGDRVTTYKTYCGTHYGPFLGIAPTHRKIHFESVDVMRVRDSKITDHWGVGNLLSLMQQIGGWSTATEQTTTKT